MRGYRSVSSVICKSNPQQILSLKLEVFITGQLSPARSSEPFPKLAGTSLFIRLQWNSLHRGLVIAACRTYAAGGKESFGTLEIRA
jgi:hypothetical protein